MLCLTSNFICSIENRHFKCCCCCIFERNHYWFKRLIFCLNHQIYISSFYFLFYFFISVLILTARQEVYSFKNKSKNKNKKKRELFFILICVENDCLFYNSLSFSLFLSNIVEEPSSHKSTDVCFQSKKK